MKTLRLTSGWDLTTDTAGNIAVADGKAAIAQDVASAVRVFRGELWYDTTQGVPYWQEILGYLPSAQFMKTQFIAEGKRVPNVVSIACFLTGPGINRLVGGQMQITDDLGSVAVITTEQLGVAPWYVSAYEPDVRPDPVFMLGDDGKILLDDNGQPLLSDDSPQW